MRVGGCRAEGCAVTGGQWRVNEGRRRASGWAMGYGGVRDKMKACRSDLLCDRQLSAHGPPAAVDIVGWMSLLF